MFVKLIPGYLAHNIQIDAPNKAVLEKLFENEEKVLMRIVRQVLGRDATAEDYADFTICRKDGVFDKYLFVYKSIRLGVVTLGPKHDPFGGVIFVPDEKF
jgi:hypothetical protein